LFCLRVRNSENQELPNWLASIPLPLPGGAQLVLFQCAAYSVRGSDHACRRAARDQGCMQYSPSVARLVKAKETVYMVKLASMRTASVLRVCACALPCPAFPFYSFCCRAATRRSVRGARERTAKTLCVPCVLVCSKRPAALAPTS